MILNKCHNKKFEDNQLPDKCAKLIISDPPYYRVKGEFDFVWPTFEDYLESVRIWAIECKRILADNGTLFWYGSSKKIAYAQMIFDQHFDLLSNIVVHIYDRQTNKNVLEDCRTFLNTTERLLMYSNETENRLNSVYYIRDYIREEILKSKGEIKFSTINKTLGVATNGGGVASACLSLNKSEPAMITEELYVKLQKWCAPFMSTSYKELRQEYENRRRYFRANPDFKMDVIRVSQESHNTGKYDHETVKPEKLSRILINATTRPGDLIVVPFSGSGTECDMAVKEGRTFVSFDVKQKYVDMTNERVALTLQKPTLF